MWFDIIKIEPYERAVAEEFADAEDLSTTKTRGKALKEKWERMKGGELYNIPPITPEERKLRINAYQKLRYRLKRNPTKEEIDKEVKNPTYIHPKRTPEEKRLRNNAYMRLRDRLKRNPTKEELEEERKNPTNFNIDRMQRKIRGNQSLDRKYTKDWQKEVQNRPKNYNKIFEIIRALKVQNKPLTKQNILDELVDLPTNEDNQAIEFILGD